MYIEHGIKHICVLSPDLFLLYTETMREIKNKPEMQVKATTRTTYEMQMIQPTETVRYSSRRKQIEDSF